MPIYSSSEQFYGQFKRLFEEVRNGSPEATRSLLESQMIIRLGCKDPIAEITINGRKPPVQVIYGPTPLRPDLEVHLPADALHRILLAELPLRKAIASGQMRVKGPIWKTKPLEDILRRCQDLYPRLVRGD